MAKHGYPDTFPDDGSIFNSTTSQGCTYLTFTPEENKQISGSSFWLEGVFQTAIGLLGILGNMTAIAIYWTSGSKFYTIFYRLLISLLFVHTAYIVLQVTVYFGLFSGSRDTYYTPFCPYLFLWELQQYLFGLWHIITRQVVNSINTTHLSCTNLSVGNSVSLQKFCKKFALIYPSGGKGKKVLYHGPQLVPHLVCQRALPATVHDAPLLHLPDGLVGLAPLLCSRQTCRVLHQMEIHQSHRSWRLFKFLNALLGYIRRIHWKDILEGYIRRIPWTDTLKVIIRLIH